MFDRFNAWATALVASAKDESGQTFVEYALVLSVIVVGVLLAATLDRPHRRHHGRDQHDHRRVLTTSDQTLHGQGLPLRGGP